MSHQPECPAVTEFGYGICICGESPQREPAAAPEGFDAWMKNPYTKTLQKSIEEDYVPRHDLPAADAPDALIVILRRDEWHKYRSEPKRKGDLFGVTVTPRELLRRWQRMYNAMDSKHEKDLPNAADLRQLRQDTHAALAAPAAPAVPTDEQINELAFQHGLVQPLTRDEIEEIAGPGDYYDRHVVARAIERAVWAKCGIAAPASPERAR